MYLTYKTKAGVRDTIKGKLKFPAHPHQHPQKTTQNRAQGQKGGCMRIKKTKKNQLHYISQAPTPETRKSGGSSANSSCAGIRDFAAE